LEMQAWETDHAAAWNRHRAGETVEGAIPPPSPPTVKGLGRRFSWRGYLEADAAQQRLFPEADEIPCMCFDGEDD
jgi:hypothetical protein